MVAKTLVRFGFARTPSDAKKIIAFTPFDVDLSTAYFVAAQSYNFRSSANLTQRLYEMAARGFLVVVGATRIPREMEFICDIYHPSDFD
jgi:hypothetical protein